MNAQAIPPILPMPPYSSCGVDNFGPLQHRTAYLSTSGFGPTSDAVVN
jgi:hypothetical protein